MKRLLTAIALSTTFAATGIAAAAGGHTHGAGTLDVAVEGNLLTLDLELPLDAVAGFERAPRTAAEKTALAEAAKVLNDAGLFTPTPAAGCTLQGAEVAVPFATGTADAGAHADIDAAYTFRCASPAALKGIDTTLFRHFRRLYRVDARRISPGGQGTGRLTPKTPGLAW